MEELIKNFLKERNVEHLYDDFMDMIVCDYSFRWYIFRDVERENNREDVRMELDNQDIKVSDDIIEQITDIYEDNLLDSEDWHIILNDTIYRYFKEN